MRILSGPIDGGAACRFPLRWCQLEACKREGWANCTAHQSPIAQALCHLPNIGGDDYLGPVAAEKIVAQLVFGGSRRSGIERQRQSRSGIPMPNLDRVDPMPCRDFSSRQQIIYRRSGSAPATGRNIAPSFAIPTSLGMGFQSKQRDDLFRRKRRGYPGGS